VDDTQVGALEVAIADLGALLVRMQKYRHGAGVEGAELVRAVTALGDTTRRLHRHDRLDAAAVDRLLQDASALRERYRALLAAVRGSPEYLRAVAAHGAGDAPALAATLPAVFAGLEAVPLPPALYRPLPWRRRGRPRPAADLAAECVTLRDGGFVPEGDDLSPGADAELPAIAFQDAAPTEEPIAARIATAALVLPVHRLADVGDYLIHAPRLRVPFTVWLATDLPEEEEETTPLDYPQYRRELAAALAAAGFEL
jgi:hypothetical protein